MTTSPTQGGRTVLSGQQPHPPLTKPVVQQHKPIPVSHLISLHFYSRQAKIIESGEAVYLPQSLIHDRVGKLLNVIRDYSQQRSLERKNL